MEIVKILLNISLSLFLIAPFCRADDTTTAILEEINLARTNPHLYAQYILTQADARSKMDMRAMQETVNFLSRAKPLPPLSFSNGLAMGAMAQVIDQGSAGTFGHTGTDRSTPWDRLARYGKWVGGAGENISYGVSGARQIVISLIVDSGVSGHAHRKNLFGPGFSVVGVAFGSHARYGTMCVMDFANRFIENPRYSDAQKSAPVTTAPLAANQPHVWKSTAGLF